MNQLVELLHKIEQKDGVDRRTNLASEIRGPSFSKTEARERADTVLRTEQLLLQASSVPSKDEGEEPEGGGSKSSELPRCLLLSAPHMSAASLSSSSVMSR